MGFAQDVGKGIEATTSDCYLGGVPDNYLKRMVEMRPVEIKPIPSGTRTLCREFSVPRQ
jgi:hypothetical protein